MPKYTEKELVEGEVDLSRKVFDISQEILNERIRQNKKFTGSAIGVQYHNLHFWNSILVEEVGEVSKAALDATIAYQLDFARYPKEITHMRDELIQVAAVAVAMIERIDEHDPTLQYEESLKEREHNV